MMATNDPMPSQPESKPNPDPTARTMEVSAIATAALKELFDTKVQGLETKISGFVDLMNQKFQGVSNEFTGRDVALTAALAAQTKSVEQQNASNITAANKAEAATTKQMDLIMVGIKSSEKSTDDKIAALEKLLNIATGKGTGSAQMIGFIALGISSLGVIIGVVVAIVSMLSRSPVAP